MQFNEEQVLEEIKGKKNGIRAERTSEGVELFTEQLIYSESAELSETCKAGVIKARELANYLRGTDSKKRRKTLRVRKNRGTMLNISDDSLVEWVVLEVVKLRERAYKRVKRILKQLHD